MAHCQLQPNSHWSQQSQDFTSVAAILTPCLFCLGTSSQHKRGLNSARSFCIRNCRQKPWNPSYKHPSTHQPFKKFRTLPDSQGFKPAYTSMMFHIGTPCWNTLVLFKRRLFFFLFVRVYGRRFMFWLNRAKSKLNYMLNTNLMQ